MDVSEMHALNQVSHMNDNVILSNNCLQSMARQFQRY